MEILERIMQMQNQGISDAEISTQLQNEGVSPSQINDSLNQAKVKNAVSPPENIPKQTMSESITERQPQAPEFQNQETYSQQPSPEIYPPQTQYQSYEYQQPNQQQEQYYQETPQAYSPQDYYSPQAGTSTETISEIAEQVIIEKLNEYKTKVGDIASFKNTVQDRIINIDDRLKRIESVIDNLQQAVVGKIGEFGETNAAIHQDLNNLHGTVSNLMNPLIDNINEMKKQNKLPPTPNF
ncbi:MAG: hypothetical protein KJ592_02140 [Nanoarchaeota archaeon]|nr:hypothetical protein [Nanoarchaeota archaeon]